jgi:CRISPR/Cas system-associated exonuclease Cas4 (RecB family)
MECEIVYLSLVDKEKDGTVVLTEGYENISRVYTVDESDVAVLGEEIEAVNHRIQRALKSDKWSSNPSWFNCTFCPYKHMCEDKWTQSEKS